MGMDVICVEVDLEWIGGFTGSYTKITDQSLFATLDSRNVANTISANQFGDPEYGLGCRPVMYG